MKRIGFLLALFMGVLGCICNNEPENWFLEDFEIDFFEFNVGFVENNEIQSDTVLLVLNLQNSFSMNMGALLVPSAMALSCPEPKLADGVLSIEIFSDATFGDISANELLHSVIANPFDNKNTLLDQPFELERGFDNTHFIEFLFLERPEVGSKHRFRVKMTFETGKIIEQESAQITWN